MIFDVVIVILLVFLNGFFVAAEFAIVKVRESQVEVKAKEGKPMAKITHAILQDLNAYLSATQLGITLASLALGWFGEEVASHMIMQFFTVIGLDISIDIVHTIAVIFAFFFITSLHIILGEQVPKTLAISNPERGAYAVAFPLQLFYKIFRPFIVLINGSSIVILRLFGISADPHEDEHSTEELKMLLEKGMESGAIQSEDHELIENVFHFNEVTARQVMIPRTKLVALEVSAPDEKILEVIHTEGYSRLPVYKDTVDDIVGIISTKDILKMVSVDQTIILSNHLKPAYFIPETKKINDLLKDFQKKRLHMAIVLDEFGGTAGIVTLEDVIEELVGEIQDEDDEEKPNIEKMTESEFVVSGSAPLIDINEHLRYPLPESDDYETISGYMTFLFDKIPEVNEQVESGGYLFTILKANNKSVESIRIQEVLSKQD